MKTKQYEKMSNKQQKSRVSSGNERKKGMKAKINKARRRLTATRGEKLVWTAAHWGWTSKSINKMSCLLSSLTTERQ
jgi:hypothetical protein